MEKIAMPGTDLAVSRLCAGCMGLGGGWERGAAITKEHERQAEAFIDAALGLGINFFDHANIYARGRAEEVFGRVLRARPALRGSIVLQSKVGIRWADDPPLSPQRFDFSYENITSGVEGILTRLGTDYLDILLLHRPDVLWEGEEIARAFAELKAAGKVRYFGVSNQNRAMMEYLQSFLPDPLVANQVQMSLLHHGFAETAISFNQAVPGYPDGWEGVVEYCRPEGSEPPGLEPPGPRRPYGRSHGGRAGEPTRERAQDRGPRRPVRIGARPAARGDSPRLAPQASGGDRADPGHDKAGAPRGLRQGSRGEAQP